MNTNLLIDQICRHWIFRWIVPGREDFFSEEQSPGSVALLRSLLLGVLLALRDRVHHVVAPAAQRRHLL